MSIYAFFVDNEEAGPQVASNSGWGDFCDWAQQLTDFPLITDLAEKGTSLGHPHGIPDLIEQLQEAVKNEPPSDDVASTIEGLLAALHENADDEGVYITNGMTADDGEEQEN